MHDSIFTRSNSRKENPATECIVCGDPTFRGTDYCIDCLKKIRKTEIEIQGLFNDKIASYSEDTFEFFRGARERALARFMEEARVFSMSCSVVPDRLNMSAADQFDAIVAGTHKDLSEKNSNFLYDVLTGTIRQIADRNEAVYGSPKEDGSKYGHLICPPLCTGPDVTQNIKDIAKEYIDLFLRLIAPTIYKENKKETYTHARSLVWNFLNKTDTGKHAYDELINKSLAATNNEFDEVFINYFLGDSAATEILPGGYVEEIEEINNINMDERAVALCEMAAELGEEAGEDPAEMAIDLAKLYTAFRIFKAEKEKTMHTATYLKGTKDKIGGHYAPITKSLCIHGDFNNFMLDYSDMIPEVLTHELGHALEIIKIPNMVYKGSKDFTLLDASMCFLKDLGGDNPKVSYAPEYAPGCFVVNTRYPFRYIGRIYKREANKLASTELLSNSIGFLLSNDALIPSFFSSPDLLSHALAVFYGDYIVK
jgi:hypothetical protein